MTKIPVVVKAWIVCLLIIFFAQDATNAELLALLILFLGLAADDVITRLGG